jgi:hypothetical protein
MMTETGLQNSMMDPLSDVRLAIGPRTEIPGGDQETSNIAFAPEEVATLQSLVKRYDRVIEELDTLNEQIESLLALEGIKACGS